MMKKISLQRYPCCASVFWFNHPTMYGASVEPMFYITVSIPNAVPMVLFGTTFATLDHIIAEYVE